MEHTDENAGRPAEAQPEAQEKTAQEATHALNEQRGEQQAMRPYAFQQGLTLGFINIAIGAVAYVLGPDALLHQGLTWGLSVISLGFVIFTGIRFRGTQGGLLSFGQAWKYSMVVFVVLSVMYFLWNLLLYNLIDPELKEVVLDRALQNIPESAAETTANITRFFLRPLGMLASTVMSIGFYALLSLLSGLVIRKNPPENA